MEGEREGEACICLYKDDGFVPSKRECRALDGQDIRVGDLGGEILVA